MTTGPLLLTMEYHILTEEAVDNQNKCTTILPPSTFPAFIKSTISVRSSRENFLGFSLGYIDFRTVKSRQRLDSFAPGTLAQITL
jgi:hypothetical protein